MLDLSKLEAGKLDAQRLPFDLVFMNVQMPGQNGFQVTSHAMKGDREACLASGMDDYIAKPIDVEDLWRVLSSWVPNVKTVRQSGVPDRQG